MIGIEHKASRPPAEVFPPEPWREGSLTPFAIKTWYVDQDFSNRVMFEDGGIWALPDRLLFTIDPDDVKANVGEIFARWPERFTFIRRERSAKYQRRT